MLTWQLQQRIRAAGTGGSDEEADAKAIDETLRSLSLAVLALNKRIDRLEEVMDTSEKRPD